MTRNLTTPLAAACLFLSGMVAALLWDRTSPVLRADSADRETRSDVPKAAIVGGSGSVLEQLERQYEVFAPINRSFELVAKAVSPAVVHIVAIKERQTDRNRLLRYEETGSGFITGAPGASGLFVLTNHHVVEGAKERDISICLLDGRVIKPSRFWSDKMGDIAVLELSQGDLPVARLGDSDEVSVGTWVMAIGSPFGLKHSVCQGIISARGRHEEELHDEGVENQDFLQTDAAINPGNSGGPLVNMKGEVIGINTAIATNHGGSEGVGFSIPINLAKWIMGQLVKDGKVRRGGLGVDLADVLPDRAAVLGLERPRGARILGVHQDSPAAVAGIKGDDVVLQFNGVEILDLNHLINLVSMSPIGQSAELAVWRNHKIFKVRVTIADLDAVRARQTAAAPKASRSSDGYLRRPAPVSPAAPPPPNPNPRPATPSIKPGGGIPRR